MHALLQIAKNRGMSTIERLMEVGEFYEEKALKRMLMLSMMVVVVAVLAVGCGSKNNTNASTEGNAAEDSKEAVTLSLGLLPSIDAIPFVIAHEQGFDKKHGVNLDIQTFKSAKTVM